MNVYRIFPVPLVAELEFGLCPFVVELCTGVEL